MFQGTEKEVNGVKNDSVNNSNGKSIVPPAGAKSKSKKKNRNKNKKSKAAEIVQNGETEESLPTPAENGSDGKEVQPAL